LWSRAQKAREPLAAVYAAPLQFRDQRRACAR